MKGDVVARYRPNDDMATGAVEVVATEVEILSSTLPLPFRLDEHTDANEERAYGTATSTSAARVSTEPLGAPSSDAGRATRVVRRWVHGGGDTHSDPCDAGRRARLLGPEPCPRWVWYALPQSPQIFKQILMVSGIDRYMQICRCFRDEDLRVDRQPEFTQIDLEISFATSDLVMELSERMVRAVWQEVLDHDLPEIPKMSYAESIDRFGLDAPDMRFEMELVNVEEALAETTFPPIPERALDAGGIVRPRRSGRGRRHQP